MRRILLALSLFSCQSKEVHEAPPAPPPPQENMWQDRISGAWWVKGEGIVEWADAQSACTGGFRLPTAQELKTAWQRGICKRDCPKAWATALTTTQAVIFDMTTGEAIVARKREEAASTYCIQGK